ncbi:MAG: Ig-like domain-containing protein [Thermoplasmata archaeon]|nr:Ig-like domain-containing protein [Thermoplasmata archaeon]
MSVLRSVHAAPISTALPTPPSMRFRALTVPARTIAPLVPGQRLPLPPGLPARLLTGRVIAVPLDGGDILLAGNETMVIDRNVSIGNITLHGNATLVVENASHPVTLTINGNVAMYGRSIFFVNRSNVVANETYDNEFTFFAWNTSELLVLGANASANGHQWIAGFFANSNLTVLASYWCYPNSWFPVTIAYNASVYIADSWFLSDVVMQDGQGIRSFAHLTMDGVLGFNIWMGVAPGSDFNLSVPGPDTIQSWRFPGAFNVTGVNYTIAINDSLVGFHVFTVWKASHLTVTDSPGVVIALNPVNDVLVLNGFVEGWQNSTYHQGGFDLRMLDTRVDSWNFYPYNSVATIDDSQFGEILADEGSVVTVRDSNLTGHGGYYGVFGNATLDIANSTITDQVIGYGTGTIVLDNCTDQTQLPEQILAAQQSTVVALNTRLGSNVAYATEAGGEVVVEATLTVTTEIGGAPDGDVPVLAAPASGGPLGDIGTTSANGTVAAVLVYETIRPNSTAWVGEYDVAASAGSYVDEATQNLSGPANLTLALVSAVASTTPANDTSGVGGSLDVQLTFAFSMNTSLTVAVLGAASHTATWTGTTGLAIELQGLEPGTHYEVALQSGTETAWGLRLTGPYWFNFTTATSPPAVPTVVLVVPLSASQNASVWTNVSLQFSVPMNVSLTTAAFSVSPGVPGATVTVSGTWLNWTHRSELDPRTQYTFVIGGSAVAADGKPLGQALTFGFTTATAPGRTVTTTVVPHSDLLEIGASAAAVVLAVAVGVLVWRSRHRPPPEIPPPPPEWAE